MSGLAFTLYSAGYAKGLKDCLADPDAVWKEQAFSVMKHMGAVTSDGKMALVRDAELVGRVERVFRRVLEASRAHIEALIQEAKKELPGEVPPGEEQERKYRLERLMKVKKQFHAWVPDGFVVIDVNSPNAFVHAMVPRLIFVHRGLFRFNVWQPMPEDPANWTSGSTVKVRQQGRSVEGKLVAPLPEAGCAIVSIGGEECRVEPCNMQSLASLSVIETDEQLAMLLAHEVSHVVCDHHEALTETLVYAAMAQMILLGILDPTGLLSFLAELGMGAVATYGFRLPHSRANETEADWTGLQICALAGYNPRHASTFFKQLQTLEDEVLETGRVPTWRSTHPATEDRIRALAEAEGEAAKIFEDAVKRGVGEQRPEPKPLQRFMSRSVPKVVMGPVAR